MDRRELLLRKSLALHSYKCLDHYLYDHLIKVSFLLTDSSTGRLEQYGASHVCWFNGDAGVFSSLLGRSGICHIWDTAQFTPVAKLRLGSQVYGFDMSPTGNSLSFGCTGCIRIGDARVRVCVGTYQLPGSCNSSHVKSILWRQENAIHYATDDGFFGAVDSRFYGRGSGTFYRVCEPSSAFFYFEGSLLLLSQQNHPSLYSAIDGADLIRCAKLFSLPENATTTRCYTLGQALDVQLYGNESECLLYCHENAFSIFNFISGECRVTATHSEFTHRYSHLEYNRFRNEVYLYGGDSGVAAVFQNL